MSKKIIVRVPNWIGDAVLSTTALHTLKEKFPKSPITVLAKEWVAPVFENNPDVKDIWIIKERDTLRETAVKLKEADFYLGVLLPNSLSSAILFRLAGIPHRVGYATDGRSLLLTQRVKRAPDFRKEHHVNYYETLVRSINGERNVHQMLLPFDGKDNDILVWEITEKEKDRADKLLGYSEIPLDSKIIGFAPGAEFGPAKRWFPERFAKLGDELKKKYQAEIMIFGGPGDKETAVAIKKIMKSSAVDMTGKTTLRELGALISRCYLFVTNDTGTMHVASAVKTPLVALFGSTDPVRTSPLGSKNVIVRKKVYCSPCLKKKCVRKDFLCLERITVKNVIEAVDELGVAKG